MSGFLDALNSIGSPIKQESALDMRAARVMSIDSGDSDFMTQIGLDSQHQKPNRFDTIEHAIKYLGGVPIGMVEAPLSIGTGMTLGLPTSGYSSSVAAALGASPEEAMEVGGESASHVTYTPHTRFGEDVVKAVDWLAEKPRQAIMYTGGKMMDKMIADQTKAGTFYNPKDKQAIKDPYNAVALGMTIVSTAAEFMIFAWLFKLLKGGTELVVDAIGKRKAAKMLETFDQADADVVIESLKEAGETKVPTREEIIAEAKKVRKSISEDKAHELAIRSEKFRQESAAVKEMQKFDKEFRRPAEPTIQKAPKRVGAVDELNILTKDVHKKIAPSKEEVIEAIGKESKPDISAKEAIEAVGGREPYPEEIGALRTAEILDIIPITAEEGKYVWEKDGQRFETITPNVEEVRSSIPKPLKEKAVDKGESTPEITIEDMVRGLQEREYGRPTPVRRTPAEELADIAEAILKDPKKKAAADKISEDMKVGGGNPPVDGLVVAIEYEGKVYYGEHGYLHNDVADRFKIFNRNPAKDGFAGPDGKFLSRDAALEIAKKDYDISNVAEEFGELDGYDLAQSNLKSKRRQRAKAKVRDAEVEVKKPTDKSLDKMTRRKKDRLKKYEEMEVEELPKTIRDGESFYEFKDIESGETFITRSNKPSEVLKDVEVFREMRDSKVREVTAEEVKVGLEKKEALDAVEKLKEKVEGKTESERTLRSADNIMTDVEKWKIDKSSVKIEDTIDDINTHLAKAKKDMSRAQYDIYEEGWEGVIGDINRLRTEKEVSKFKKVKHEPIKGKVEKLSDKVLEDVLKEEKHPKTIASEEFENFLSESERISVKAYVDSIDEPRSLTDIFKDAKTIYDIFPGEEGGSYGSLKLKKITPEVKEALGRLVADARRFGKDVNEIMKMYGFNPEQMAEVNRALKEVGDGVNTVEKTLAKKEPPKTFTPAEDNSVIQIHRAGARGTKNQPITENISNIVFYSNELKSTQLGRAFENTIRTFEEVDASLNGSGFGEIVRRKFIEGEHNVTVRLRDTVEKLNNLSEGLSRRKKRDVGIYAISMQEKGSEILKNMGIEEVPKWDNLGAKGQKAYTDMRKMFEELFDEINNIREQVGLRKMKKVEDYFTFFRTFSNLELFGKGGKVVRTNLTLDNISSIVDKFDAFKAASFGMAKTRTKFGLPVVELDPFAVFERYARTAYRHIELSPTINLVNQILKGTKNPETGGHYSIKVNKPILAEYLAKYSNFMAGRPSINLPPLIEVGLRKLNQNMAFAVLGGNLRSALIQPTALLNTTTEIGVKHAFEGIKDMMSTEMRDFAMTESKVLASRLPEAAFNSVGSMIRDGMLSKAHREIGRGSLWGLMILDRYTATATWLGAYKYAKEVKGIRSRSKRVAYADDVVVRTQASSMAADLSPVQRSAIGKFLTMFQTFTINNWGFLIKDVVGIRSPNALPTSARVKKMMSYMTGAFLISTLYESLGMHSPLPTPIRDFADAKDEGKTDLEAAKASLIGMADIIPGPGGYARYGGSIYGAGFGLISDTAKKLSGIEPDINKRSYLELAGKWTGVPGTSQMAKYFKGQERGESIYGSVMGSYTRKGDKKTRRGKFRSQFGSKFGSKSKNRF